MSFSFPPLEGVSPLGAQPPAAHYGSGIVIRFDDPQPEKNINSPRMFIRMDDGGEGFEGSEWIDLVDPTAEKKFQDIAKAKWRSKLESVVGQDGGSRYTPAQLNTTASGPGWLLNQRVCYAFVPRGTDGGEWDEFQFITPAELKAKRAAGALPRRSEHSKKAKKKGGAGGANADAGHAPPATFDAPPPAGGGFAAPPGGFGGAGPGQAPPQGNAAPPAATFAPPPGFGGGAPQGGGGAAPPPV